MYLRKAELSDTELLAELRLEFTEVCEGDREYEPLKESCLRYFEKAFADNTCDAMLAEDNGKIIGTGIVFYYDSVPSPFNITGKNAYITSMYVSPEYRHQGIGSQLLECVIEAARKRGYVIIMLNASEAGRGLYEKHGFSDIHNGMLLNLREQADRIQLETV